MSLFAILIELSNHCGDLLYYLLPYSCVKLGTQGIGLIDLNELLLALLYCRSIKAVASVLHLGMYI